MRACGGAVAGVLERVTCCPPSLIPSSTIASSPVESEDGPEEDLTASFYRHREHNRGDEIFFWGDSPLAALAGRRGAKAPFGLCLRAGPNLSLH